MIEPAKAILLNNKYAQGISIALSIAALSNLTSNFFQDLIVWREWFEFGFISFYRQITTVIRDFIEVWIEVNISRTAIDFFVIINIFAKALSSTLRMHGMDIRSFEKKSYKTDERGRKIRDENGAFIILGTERVEERVSSLILYPLCIVAVPIITISCFALFIPIIREYVTDKRNETASILFNFYKYLFFTVISFFIIFLICSQVLDGLVLIVFH